MSSSNFSSLSLKPELFQNLSSLGYHQMTPIQEKSLRPILDGRDVLAQAKTGSGKTAAFSLGLLSKISVNKRGVQALVLCPTRELAEQVAKEIRRLARMIPNIKVLTLCGGTPLGPQAASLEHGAHCVVGTPGRVEDHLGKRTLNLRNVQTLVLDEADRMLDMGFSEVLEKIIRCTPNYRQTLMFSATYPEHIQKLGSQFQKNSIQVKVDAVVQPSTIEQVYFEVSEKNKAEILSSILLHHQLNSVVVFCNTKLKCQELADQLRAKGFSAQAIHGDLEQRERDLVLALFANKSTSILVATDVAARGLDIQDLEAVVNCDITSDPEVHVHRVGRTGRAGKKGIAFTLLQSHEMRKLQAIEDYQKRKITKGQKEALKRTSAKLLPATVSLRIAGGKKNKLRPADILGAITVGAVLQRDDVGKIDIFDFHAFVAVSRNKVDQALEVLKDGRIKGRSFRVQRV